MAFRWQDQREFFKDARRARYLSRLVAKSADLIIAMSLWHVPGAAGAFAQVVQQLLQAGPLPFGDYLDGAHVR